MSLRNYKRSFRYRALNPSRYGLDLAIRTLNSLRNRATTVTSQARIIAISDGRELTAEEQFNPFSFYRAQLRDKCGVVSLHLLLADVLRAPKWLLGRFDVVLLKLSFRLSRDEAVRIVTIIRDAIGVRPLIYFDGDDDLCLQWPEILPLVDLYVKKHAFRDRTAYLRSYVGKSNLTDYVHHKYGISFTYNLHATRTEPVPESQLHKIVVGWNLALDSNILRLHRSMSRMSDYNSRAVDIMFRGSVPLDWVRYLRQDIEPMLDRLQSRYSVIIPRNRVDRSTYFREMANSKLCVSPFGYGEICWRDFEAILCGSVLVKPNMDHVETFPNVFVPHVTYVPVRWDYADLEEQCDRYLSNPAESQRIIEEARNVLLEFYAINGFKISLEAILRRL